MCLTNDKAYLQNPPLPTQINHLEGSNLRSYLKIANFECLQLKLSLIVVWPQQTLEGLSGTPCCVQVMSHV